MRSPPAASCPPWHAITHSPFHRSARLQRHSLANLGGVMFAERSPAIALAALVFLVLNATLAGLLVAAVYGFDLALFNEGGRLVERGPQVSGLLRVAMFVDMIGYLALAPVAIYLHRPITAVTPENLRRLGLPTMLTAAAVGFALIGASGSAIFGSVAPLLLQEAAAGPEAFAAAQLQLAAFEKFLYIGLWGTLELPLLAIWMVGVSWLAPAEKRVFRYLGWIGGLGLLAYALRCALTGQTPFALAGPVDWVTLAMVGALWPWMAMLTYRLWRGP